MQLPLREFKHSPTDESTTGGKRRKVRVTIAKGNPFDLERGFKWRGHIFARQTTGIKSRVYFDAKERSVEANPSSGWPALQFLPCLKVLPRKFRPGCAKFLSGVCSMKPKFYWRR